MSFFSHILPPKEIPPEKLNEHGQVTDKKLLSKERFKFGFANIMFQGEEAGIGAVHTIIIRALDGTSLHLGISGGIGSIGSVVQWMGMPLLKKYNSNRKAMAVALGAGAVLGFLVALAILLGLLPDMRLFALWAYIFFGFLLAAASGVQWNIETNWIGDLVPKENLGWFTGAKWVVAVFGILCFVLFFGKLADKWPNLYSYSFMFIVIGVSHIIAILLIKTIIDRVPRNANFISAGTSHHERLNYKSMPLWCYIIFYLLWSGGRTPMYVFSVAYLLDQFHYSITKIALIGTIQGVVSMIMLLVMGKVTDKFGCRLPLLLVSGFMALVMSLWFLSAWWGIVPVIIFNILNGFAGHTHSLLAVNYGLEIFPDKGRSGYFGFSRLLMGLGVAGISMLAGIFLHCIEGFHFRFLGADLNHYHVLFFCCMLVTASCTIPLIIVGKRTVQVS